MRLRLLFYNTFLLRILELPGRDGPRPVGGAPVPAVRAAEIARRVAGSYDVAAFAEVFDGRERRTLLRTWEEVSPGPVTAASGSPGLGPFKSSGLYTIVDGLRVRRVASKTFRSRGLPWRDSDSYANKGVLLVEVDPGLGSGAIEIYSTHLIYGNDLIRRPGHPYVACWPVRERQLIELVAFVEAQHRPENVMILVGDMNTPASTPLVDPPDRLYRRMMQFLGRLGFEDRWPIDGRGEGFTSGLDREHADTVGRADPEDERFVYDDPPVTDEETPQGLPRELPPEAGERIDYFFLQAPCADHRIRVRPVAFRRRSFPREPGAVGYSRLRYCSDHLALHVELEVEGAGGRGRA
ncbi:MAG: hypothetical protein KatS3mg008_2259 [Acidimicrobiales bacterium]|nr:MAG: hypothetical protein KatS3mg008_2259 [Acidimicrobiales bacterium]